MLKVDFPSASVLPALPVDEKYIFSSKTSDDIFLIQSDLSKLMVAQEWIDPERNTIVPRVGRENIGFNMFDTNLEALFLKDSEKGYVLDQDLALRFEDNSDTSSFTSIKDVQRLLRIRYGDALVGAYATRLLLAFFDTVWLEETYNEYGLESFSEMYFSGWWLICAYQSTILYINARLIQF